MEEFLARLKTFKLSTWMLKPKELSPVECAKRGYVNTAKDTILCTHCSAEFTANTYYESDILDLHASYCKLSLKLTLSYEHLHYFSEAEFRTREASLASMEVLPRVSFPDIDKILVEELFPAFPRIHLKTIYALFGWTGGFKRLHCEMCGISIECCRNAYSLVKTRNWFNVFGKVAGEGVSLRAGQIESGKSVDLVKSHRYYCPWVNDLTVNDFSYYTTASTSSNTGWKILSNLILSNTHSNPSKSA